MIRRPRRSAPATIVALVLLAICVLVAIAVIQSLLGQQPFVRLEQLVSFTARQRWNGVLTIVVAIVVAVLGLVLLVAALRPGKPTVLPLARITDRDGSPVADAGVRRQTLSKDLTAAASTVPGVSRARVSARRGSVVAEISTAAADSAAVPGQVKERLETRLTEIGPARTPRVKVRARRDRNT